MKNPLIFLFLILILTSCVSDSSQESTTGKTDSLNTYESVDSLLQLEKDSAIKVLNDEIEMRHQESNRDTDSNLNNYLNTNFNNNYLYGSYGNKLSEEELEKKLKEEFANIDPLEYYLQNNLKYTDKQAMFKKKDELANLIEVYRKKYYDKGHLQEMRENNAVLVSLISDAYPSELYKKYDSISNKENANLVSFKKNKSTSFEDDSDNPLSELNRAVQLLNEDRYDAANTILTKLVNESLTNNYLANYNKAFVSYKLDNFKNAIKYSNRALLSREDFYLGYLLLGESYLSIGDYNQALKAFQKSLSIKQNVVSLERTAYASMLKGDYPSALRFYSLILEMYFATGLRNYNALRAFSRIIQGQNNEAIATSKHLGAIHEDWAIPSLIVAYNELYLGNNNESVKYFNKAIGLGETFYGKLGIAISYYKEREFSKASDLFLTLNRNNEFNKLKFHKELLLMQIFSHTNNDKYLEALEKLGDYASYHQKDDYYYLGMSLISYDKFDFKKADLYLDSIKTYDLFDADYSYLRGLFALRNKNLNVAKQYFNKSIKEEINLRALNGLGGIYNEQGDFESAMNLFQKGLLVDPNNPYLLYNKASSLFLKGKKLHTDGDTTNARESVEFACDLLRKAKSLHNSFIIDLNIGNAYSSIRDYTMATHYYNSIDNNYSRVNVGVLEAQLNKLPEAKEIWENVMQTTPFVELAKANLKESSKSNPKYTSYYYYYYDVSVDVQIPVPIIFDDMFEPLVPLGHSSFKFHTLTKD